jgi:hypothetical protein
LEKKRSYVPVHERVIAPGETPGALSVIAALGWTLEVSAIPRVSSSLSEVARKGGTPERVGGDPAAAPTQPVRIMVDASSTGNERIKVRTNLFGPGERLRTMSALKMGKFTIIDLCVATEAPLNAKLTESRCTSVETTFDQPRTE